MQRHIAIQWQHAASVAVHGGDSVEQRQVGGQNLLLLAGHDQIVHRLRGKLIAEQLLHLCQIAGIIRDVREAEEAVQARVAEQMSWRCAQRTDRLRRSG